MNLRATLRIPSDRTDLDLFGLCIFVGFAFFGMTMAAPLIPLVLLKMNASPGLLGAVISVSAVGSLIVAVPGGILVGKWGSARLMSLSSLICAGSTLLLTFFPSIAVLFVGLVFFEIGKILFIVGAQAHIGNLGEGRDLNLDFGWYGMANSLGQLLGPFLAGIIIDGAGHAATWAIMTGILAVIGLVLPRFVANRALDSDLSAPKTDEPKKKKGLRYYLNDYAIIAIIASFAVLFADGARTTFFPVLMDNLGYSATVIGFFLSLRALVSMSVRGFMGRFIKLVGGRFPALIISIIVMGFGIGITPFCDNYLTLTLNAALVGIGLGLSLPLSMATVSEGVPPEDRGVAMGIRLTGNRLAQLFNPVFFGLLAQNLGFSLSFIAGGMVLMLCALPIFLWWKDKAGAAK